MAYLVKTLPVSNFITHLFRLMTITTIATLLIIGLIAGMLSGMVGIGGGIIIVPCLVFFLAMNQKTAQGTSLALLMTPVGILGVINYYKSGNVDIKTAAILAIAFVGGSFLGSKVALGISDAAIKKVFGIIMLLVSIKYLFFSK